MKILFCDDHPASVFREITNLSPISDILVDHSDKGESFSRFDMTTLQNLSAEQLRKAISIKEQIERLEAQLADIGSESPAATLSPDGRKTHKRSKAARMAMAAAQKARWAKLKSDAGEVVAPKKRRKMSAAGKAKIAAAAKARWAKVKAAGKNKL